MQILLVREKQFFLGGYGWRKREGRKRRARDSRVYFIPTVNHIDIFGESTTEHHLQGIKDKIQSNYVPFPSTGQDRESISHIQRAAWWASSLTVSVPLLRTMPPFPHQFRRPSGPPCSGPFWNHELLPAFNVPAPEEPQTLFLGRPHPQVPLLQTEVTVLTLAERACLNLLFRSCMLGDLGLGMREVLRFSGMLLGGCLWLTSLHRTWKAL